MVAVGVHIDIMNAAATTPTASTLVTCTKCGGSRRFRVSSINTGKTFSLGSCFECEGTGKITAAKRETSQWTRARMGGCNYTANIVIMAARDGNDERAEFYMRALVKDLFLLGTTHARMVLGTLAAGEWTDDNAYSHEDTRGRIPMDQAAALRARVIELGRAAKA